MDTESSSSINLLKSTVNFVYNELLDEFIKNNGKCKETTVYLANWSYLLDPANNREIIQHLEIKTLYKCNFAYLVGMISKYFKENNGCVFIHLLSHLNSFNFSISNDFKKICYKKMANIVKLDQNGQSSKEMKNILMIQDLIEDIDGCTYEGYTDDDFFNDVCNVIKNLKYMNEKSLVKTVLECSDEVEDKVIELIEKKAANEREPSQTNLVEKESTIQDILSSLASSSNNAIEIKKLGFDDSVLNASENEINGNEQDDEKENVEDSNNTSPKRHYNKWTEHEALILVYLVTKIGKDFSAIITNYEQYFPNRTKEHLANKYNSLRGTKKLRSNLLKNLEKQASSLTDIPIVKIEKEQHEHKKNLNWKFKETLNLFIGVQKYGLNWERILTEHKNKFEESCTVSELSYRYMSLKEQPDIFKYFEEKASVEIQNENLN